MGSHPFAVQAFFRRSLVLAYSVPAEELRPWVSPGLTLDTFKDAYGFLAIALVETERLRPQGFPTALGRSFFLSGYRIFTRFRSPAGATNVRGLQILRSDTNRQGMKWLGNWFTSYNYELARVHTGLRGASYEVRVETPGGVADLAVRAELDRTNVLPEGSVFSSVDEARRFAGPMPHTFSYDRQRDEMMVVKGVRAGWKPTSVAVTVSQAAYTHQISPNARLANAFYVENIDYAWAAGEYHPIIAEAP